MRILSAQDYRETAWKNGGGKTAQIAVFPQSADMESFIWRLSMATVTVDAPFSNFAGVDRSLVMLSGNGMELAVNGFMHTMRSDGEPMAFDGGAQVDARLIDGAITDLNVMTRRDRAKQIVRRIKEGCTINTAAAPVALFAAQQTVFETAGQLHQLDRHDTALPTSLKTIRVVSGEVIVVWIELAV